MAIEYEEHHGLFLWEAEQISGRAEPTSARNVQHCKWHPSLLSGLGGHFTGEFKNQSQIFFGKKGLVSASGLGV